MDKELLEKLYRARTAYKLIEREIYFHLKKEFVGSYELPGEVKASIGISKSYTYDREFRKFIKDLYSKYQQKHKLIPKETLYIRYKNEQE